MTTAISVFFILMSVFVLLGLMTTLFDHDKIGKVFMIVASLSFIAGLITIGIDTAIKIITVSPH